MKAWQVVLGAGAGANGLVMAALLLGGQPELITSVIAGALLPILISSALLFYGESREQASPEQLQKVNIIGFLAKVVLLGGWAAALIKSENLHLMTFIVTLIGNFLAWHGVEAYYWQLYMTARQDKGENS